MASLPDLTRRLSLAIERGAGIRLSADDLSLMEECGALDVLPDFTFPEIRRVCESCAKWVYFIQAGDNGPIKIGFGKNPEARRTGHQTSNHAQLRIVGLLPGDQGVESDLHDFYAREHIRGEWFEPSFRMLAFLEHIGGADA